MDREVQCDSDLSTSLCFGTPSQHMDIQYIQTCTEPVQRELKDMLKKAIFTFKCKTKINAIYICAFNSGGLTKPFNILYAYSLFIFALY